MVGSYKAQWSSSTSRGRRDIGRWTQKQGPVELEPGHQGVKMPISRNWSTRVTVILKIYMIIMLILMKRILMSKPRLVGCCPVFPLVLPQSRWNCCWTSSSWCSGPPWSPVKKSIFQIFFVGKMSDELGSCICFKKSLYTYVFQSHILPNKVCRIRFYTWTSISKSKFTFTKIQIKSLQKISFLFRVKVFISESFSESNVSQTGSVLSVHLFISQHWLRLLWCLQTVLGEVLDTFLKLVGFPETFWSSFLKHIVLYTSSLLRPIEFCQF